MNMLETQAALRSLRLSGMAQTLEARIVQAQSDKQAPLDFVGTLITDEKNVRQQRLLQRRINDAQFRDAGKRMESFDLEFNKKMDRKLIYELLACGYIQRHEDVLMLGPPGTGKSHLAQALGFSAIQQGYRVRYREAHALLEELAEASVTGSRKVAMEELSAYPLLIIDDLGMRKLPHTAAEDLLELIMRRYERASTIMTSNRPVEDWGKLLGDHAAVAAMLDRLMHNGHILKCGPRSYRNKDLVPDTPRTT
jgi:DNA replication protein DnaC